MGPHYGSWAFLIAVALFVAFGVTSGKMMLTPEEFTICPEDTLMKASIQEHQGEDGQKLFTGYMYSPVDIDGKILVVLKVHKAKEDGWEEEPTEIKVPNPCVLVKYLMPDVTQALASIVNSKPQCPVPKGNYTFADHSLKIPLKSTVLPVGTYKVDVESFQEEKKASCAVVTFKIVDE